MYLFLNRFYQIVPILLSALLILISAGNDGTVYDYTFTPAIAAICVFYWVFTYPDLIGSLTVFVIGLISDIIFLQPLGLDSFSLLVAYLLTSYQRDDVIKYGFLVVWGFFAYFLVIFYMVKLIVAYIYLGDVFFSFDMIMQYILTFLTYPVCHRILAILRFKKIISLRI
jgi:rod shape-determining protein MreD